MDTWRNERGNEVTCVTFESAEDAVMAHAVYLKYAEVRLSEKFKEFAQSLPGESRSRFEDQPVETRFALLRYFSNPGERGIDYHLRRVVEGEDFLVRRTMGAEATMDRWATIHSAQAIHVSQKFFGTDLR